MRLFRAILLALTTVAFGYAQSAAAPAKAPKTLEATAALTDINSASLEDLQKLPGIGPAYAEKIVRGRPYRGKNDLVANKVIPAATYDKIRDRIIAKQK
ncbi:MAG TPA: helix-hairpin-helix domain-containing protein [Bryobacteraceae bacterium]|nr:helix-hairpin-helix domain-containing protein [Bryobacteraceae bacterium]